MRKQRTGLKKEQFLTIVILMILWQLLAMSVNNDILIPMPLDVARRMLADVSQPAFYAQTLSTLGRMLKGFGISLILALVCGFAAATQPVIRRLIEPLEVIVKTIPNLSYIMIFLIWLGSEGSVMVTSFCVLFPVFYTAVLLSQDLLDSELQDVLRCYPGKIRVCFLESTSSAGFAASVVGDENRLRLRLAGLRHGGGADAGENWNRPADVVCGADRAGYDGVVRLDAVDYSDQRGGGRLVQLAAEKG